jgi:hypothetical protein
MVPLFNPRTDQWEEHFQWSPNESTLLEGVSSRGRATLQLLQMNHPNMIDIRRLLVSLNLFHA